MYHNYKISVIYMMILLKVINIIAMFYLRIYVIQILNQCCGLHLRIQMSRKLSLIYLKLIITLLNIYMLNSFNPLI